MSFRIKIGELELMRFTPSSARELYSIRNHDSVRRYMANTKLIPYKAHTEWVRNNLIEGQNLLLFMVRPKARARAIGFTQLRIEENAAEIGVIFKEAQYHRLASALSTVVTLHLAFCYLNLNLVVSYVLPTHKSAISFNCSFGGRQVESDKPGMIKLQVSRDECLNNEHYVKVFNRIKGRIEVEGTMGLSKGANELN